jgi:RNA polymerase sigma factor (TIGR02999 family)
MLQQQLERLIQSAEQGDARSREELFTLLYGELHRLAQRELRRNASLTMSPTTLLHETYLNLSGRESTQFPDRARFLAYAARAMRGLLIDYVRSRRAQKRGGAFEITSLPTELPERDGADAELEGIGEALKALESIEPRLAQLVDLKFFCGFSFGEIGELLGIRAHRAARLGQGADSVAAAHPGSGSDCIRRVALLRQLWRQHGTGGGQAVDGSVPLPR